MTRLNHLGRCHFLFSFILVLSLSIATFLQNKKDRAGAVESLMDVNYRALVSRADFRYDEPARRSSIQVVEFEYKDGWLSCQLDKPTYMNLKPVTNTSK